MNSSSRQRLDLDRQAFAQLSGRTQQRLRVLCGRIWLTVDGEPDDHILERGDEIVLAPGAQALIEALDAPAQVLVHKAPSRVERGLQSLRDTRQRLQFTAVAQPGLS